MPAMKILLKNHVTRGEVEYMALDYEWQVYTAYEHSEQSSSYKVWLDGEGEHQSVIVYTDDDFVELRYMSVDGVDAKLIVDQIRASLDVYSREELEGNIERASRYDEWIKALRILGASLSKTFEPWAFDALRKGLNHSDPRVRLAAIAAIGFPAWHEFLEPLTRVQETDSDVRVLRRAARMAGLLKEANK